MLTKQCSLYPSPDQAPSVDEGGAPHTRMTQRPNDPLIFGNGERVEEYTYHLEDGKKRRC